MKIASRRSFIRGVVTLLAAPAIVRVASIMSVRAFVVHDPRIIDLLEQRMKQAEALMRAALDDAVWGSGVYGQPNNLEDLLTIPTSVATGLRDAVGPWKEWAVTLNVGEIRIING